MKNIHLKILYPYLIAILLFIITSYLYFTPLLEKKVLNQSDISSWRGAANEIIDFRNETKEEPLWTNSMFGGMPSTMISTIYKGNFLQKINNILFVGPGPASTILLTMVSFFLLMLVLGVNPWLSIVGSIAFAFCAYNFQIIQVGHNSKMVAIALMPMTLAAIIYAYQKKALLGSVLFGITLGIEILANHPQITFYLAMIIIAYGLGQLYLAVKNKALPKFIKTSCLIIVATLLAAGANINHLWPTWEYAKYTMRGGSELSPANTPASQSSGGLDKKYATAWSYDIDETVNLLIPNYKGGASGGALSKDSETYKTLKQGGAQNAEQMIKQMPLYWGNQPFTAGPSYIGAIVVFLFVLGLLLVKGPMKWWIASISLLALMLAWGHNFMWLTNLFFDYVPLYNKFRVPAMILVILQVTAPLLGFYALSQVFSNKIDKKQVIQGLKIALGMTAGLCALIALVPGIAGSFVSASDSQYPEWLQQTLVIDRKSLLRADAFRSLIYILLAAGVIWLGYLKKIKIQYAIIGLGILILADMWTIDKRYLNDDHFVTPREFNNNFELRPVDNEILKDTDPNYRVLDLTINTFNDSHISYHHKTIGGYSPAKLQRYQDMIDYHIMPEMQSFTKDLQQGTTYAAIDSSLAKQHVLNMLNTKYIVINPQGAPIENRSASGNAWFVKDYKLVDSPDEEILSLKTIDPSQTAIIGKDFADLIKDKSFNYDENGEIKLISYAPNKLEYKTQVTDEQLAIFSEVYYPKGWKVYIDGKPVELLRADYILRAMVIPAGEHNITFRFEPGSYHQGALISGISSGILLLLLIASIIFYSRKYFIHLKTGQS